jgi:hypothetical protein
MEMNNADAAKTSSNGKPYKAKCVAISTGQTRGLSPLYAFAELAKRCRTLLSAAQDNLRSGIPRTAITENKRSDGRIVSHQSDTKL